MDSGYSRFVSLLRRPHQNLHVPDWFDASMDIAIQLGIAMAADRSSVAVQPYTNVHITWTWVQDLAGRTDFGQKLSQAFMSDIVENEIAPQFAQQINGLIQAAATVQQQSDPQHRPFALTAFSFGTDISFTLCPQG